MDNRSGSENPHVGLAMPSLQTSLERILLKGFGKGFLVYFLPMTVMRRKFSDSVFRRSVAIGSYVAMVRFVGKELPLLLQLWRQALLDQKHVLEAATASTSSSKASSPSSSDDSTSSVTPTKDENANQGQLNRVKIKFRFCSLLLEILEHYREAFAGFLAGFTTVSIDPSLLNSTLILWLLVRAIRSSTKIDIPGAATIGMCLSAGQIFTRFLFEPQDLYPGYYKFLFRQSGRTKEQLGALAFYPEHMCTSHSGRTCLNNVYTFFFENFFESLKVYFPLYILFFVFSGKRGVSMANLRSFISNVTRSSLFLTTYCTLAITSGCFFYTFISKGLSKSKVFLHGSFAGLATLIERPSRRSELCAYCVTYALDSLYRSLKRNYLERGQPDSLKFSGPIETISSLLAVASSSMLLHHHHQQPALLTKWLLDLSV